MLADTAQLHQKIYEMSKRIRQLEEALSAFQSGVSAQPHPLLSDDLLLVKLGPETQQTEDLHQDSSEDALADAMDAFGTLAIGESGEFRYFGRSGGSEVC